LHLNPEPLAKSPSTQRQKSPIYRTVLSPDSALELSLRVLRRKGVRQPQLKLLEKNQATSRRVSAKNRWPVTTTDGFGVVAQLSVKFP
jgi:hypothetical protein